MGLSFPGLLGLSDVVAQADKPLPTIVTELSPGIYNIYYVSRVSLVAFTGDDGMMLVDAGYEGAAEEIRNKLDSTDVAPLKYIVNTHWHADHTGGNIPFGNGVDIIAHDYVHEMLSHEQLLLGRKKPAFPEYAQPNITFSDRMTIRFNGQDVELIHLEGGHTGGDILVWFPEANVLVMGDLIFADNFPYVDVDHGGDPVTFVDNLKWVTDNFPEDIIIVPGHGRIYDMSDLRSWQSNLQKTIEIIREALDSGLTADQMKEQKILSEFADYGKWWITEDNWIDVVVKSYSKETSNI
ncbi:MBL fold metallo-hydrolase [Bacteroidota bacterium]